MRCRHGPRPAAWSTAMARCSISTSGRCCGASMRSSKRGSSSSGLSRCPTCRSWRRPSPSITAFEPDKRTVRSGANFRRRTGRLPVRRPAGRSRLSLHPLPPQQAQRPQHAKPPPHRNKMLGPTAAGRALAIPGQVAQGGATAPQPQAATAQFERGAATGKASAAGIMATAVRSARWPRRSRNSRRKRPVRTASGAPQGPFGAAPAPRTDRRQPQHAAAAAPAEARVHGRASRRPQPQPARAAISPPPHRRRRLRMPEATIPEPEPKRRRPALLEIGARRPADRHHGCRLWMVLGQRPGPGGLQSSKPGALDPDDPRSRKADRLQGPS